MTKDLPLLYTHKKHVAIVNVTPEIATDWLRFNRNNRKVSDSNRQRFGAALESDTYQFNGDTIRWSSEATLEDGQHRLMEVVRTGISIETVVVWGIAPEAGITIDRNKRRTLRDHLDRSQETNTRELATVLNLCVQWGRGQRFTIGHQNGLMLPSYEQADEFLRDHPNIRASVEFATHMPAARKVINPAHLAVLHWIFSDLAGDDADEFLAKVISGDHRSANDPEWKLRERLFSLRQEHTDKPWIVLPLACKAWNYWRAGDSLRYLRIRTGGSNPESFPEPK